jgi:hypothetical protein
MATYKGSICIAHNDTRVRGAPGRSSSNAFGELEGRCRAARPSTKLRGGCLRLAGVAAFSTLSASYKRFPIENLLMTQLQPEWARIGSKGVPARADSEATGHG